MSRQLLSVGIRPELFHFLSGTADSELKTRMRDIASELLITSVPYLFLF